MESQIDVHKSALIKAKIRELQAINPKRTFASSWAELQRKEPALFETEPGWDSETGDEYGQVRQPHLSVNAGVKTPFLDLLQVCREMRLPVKIAASRAIESSDYIMLRAEDCDRLLAMTQV